MSPTQTSSALHPPALARVSRSSSLPTDMSILVTLSSFVLGRMQGLSTVLQARVPSPFLYPRELLG